MRRKRKRRWRPRSLSHSRPPNATELPVSVSLFLSHLGVVLVHSPPHIRPALNPDAAGATTGVAATCRGPPRRRGG